VADELHQIARVTQDRLVPWKCLSLRAESGRLRKKLIPVAYASRSPTFLARHFERDHRPRDRNPEAVLWVIAAPYLMADPGKRWEFPPTLVAKIVVGELYRGDDVRRWATDAAHADLSLPQEPELLERWSAADSVEEGWKRSTFRVARGFAQHRRRPGWERVRVAVADTGKSVFYPHIDVSDLLADAVGLERPQADPASLETFAKGVNRKLQSPNNLRPEAVAAFEARAERAGENPIFLSYRHERGDEKVRKLARSLIRCNHSVWLDRLAIPEFRDLPEWKLGEGSGPQDPGKDDLRVLLNHGIGRCALFLACATREYSGRPTGRKRGRCWAFKELKRARGLSGRRRPAVRIVNLGELPDDLARPDEEVWNYSEGVGRLVEKVQETLGPPRR
jgi:hypothetical protein